MSLFNRKNNQNNNSFTTKLQGWATGKLAKTIMGLAIGYTIYKTGIIKKLINKIRGKDESETRRQPDTQI